MYDMYPQDWPEAITQRGCEAELRKWEADGATEIEPRDFVDARTVAVADRAALADRLDNQVATLEQEKIGMRSERLGFFVANAAMREQHHET